MSDAVHEMLIVLARGTYIRPHQHPGKSESFHIIRGRADVVLFTDSGAVRQIICLGDYASGLCFYYRLADPVFHTVIVQSDDLLVHETTRGPFDPAETVFAPWAPEEGDVDAVREFQERLAGEIIRRK